MTVTLAGNPIEVGGHFPQVGEIVENFILVGNDLTDVALNDFAGKRKVLNIFQASTQVYVRLQYVNLTNKRQN